MTRTYRGTTIERDYRGYYVAMVLTPEHYYRPVQADTLAGIKELIRHYLRVPPRRKEL